MEILENQILQEAQELEKKGEYSTAIQKYQQLLKKNSKSFSLLQSLGKCYFKQKDFLNALTYFEKVSNIYPSEENFYNKAECLLFLNKNLEAIESLKKLLGINPAYLKANILLSKIYAESKNYFKQEKYLQSILRYDPKNTFALKEIALLYEKTNRPKEGLTYIEAYLYHNQEKNILAEMLRIQFLLQMGQYASAWEHLKESMQTNLSLSKYINNSEQKTEIQNKIKTLHKQMQENSLEKKAKISFQISLLYLLLGDIENSSKYLIYSKKLNEDKKISKLKIQNF